MTRDHVPPKGSVRITQVEMFSILDAIGLKRPGKKGKNSQDGVKFHSLCGRCNNNRLGSRYDPALNHFSNELGAVIRSPIHLPRWMDIQIQPNRVSRAVIGHLMAVGHERYNQGTMTVAAREYFLDESAELPENLRIYYWMYPYNRQVLVRDALLNFRLLTEANVVFWLLKYFPVAFMVQYNPPDTLTMKTQSLDGLLNNDIDHSATVRIDRNNIPRYNWPEAPDDDSAVFYMGGDSAIGAHEKRKRVKQLAASDAE